MPEDDKIIPLSRKDKLANGNEHLLNRVLIGISTTLAIGAVLGGLNTWRTQSVHAQAISQLATEQTHSRTQDQTTRETVIRIENDLDHIKIEQHRQRVILERIEKALQDHSNEENARKRHSNGTGR